MIAGLPWGAWLLLVAAVGLGVSIELIFYFNHRRGRGLPPDLPGKPGRPEPAASETPEPVGLRGDEPE